MLEFGKDYFLKLLEWSKEGEGENDKKWWRREECKNGGINLLKKFKWIKILNNSSPNNWIRQQGI